MSSIQGVSHASLLLTLDNKPALDEKKAELLGDASDSGWVLLNYVGPDTVHFAASGAGAVEQLSENLNDGQTQYALVRIGGIQEKGSLKSTVRDVFVTWIGPEVSVAEKTGKLLHESDAQSFLAPFHAAITVCSREHFTTDR
ncbi:hypothetical protein G3M48_009283 [Beauveria asiatica]|uniref:ADF-H domain-containing protein n=1 Tax=Beauveria asiatica TaxID=1069075 RepID=A0AAW0RIY5_9HYPO